MSTREVETREEVRATLELFQIGYTRRDVEKLDQIMNLFADEATLEVIGTGATLTSEGEWCMGPEMTRELVVDAILLPYHPLPGRTPDARNGRHEADAR